MDVQGGWRVEEKGGGCHRNKGHMLSTVSVFPSLNMISPRVHDQSDSFREL